MKYLICFLSMVPLAMTRDQCLTKEGRSGVCSELRDCPSLFQLSHILPGPTILKEYGGCGIRNNNIRLCCPDDSGSKDNPVDTVVTPTSNPVTTESESKLPQPTTPSTHVRLECKGEYSSIAGKCLYISKDQDKWSDAESLCGDKNGKLAVLEDVEGIAKYLRSNHLGGASAWYWVGANDQQTPGTFKWSTSEVVQGPWRDFKPWSNQPGRMCVYITDQGLGRTPCLDATWYICEA